jgi:hypothetical protein
MRKLAGLAAAAAVVAASSAAAVVVRRRRCEATRWARADAILGDLEELCAVPAERLCLVADAMAAEMRSGLSANDEVVSSLKMLVTYVDFLPSG